MSTEVQIAREEAVSAERRTQILDLVEAATSADGVSPLDEQSLLQLRDPAGSPGVRHLLALRGDLVAGYAITSPDDEAGRNGELAVHPGHRGIGIGASLVEALQQDAPALHVWAHGNLPAAQALAQRAGFDKARVLWQLRRPLDESIAEATLPDGVEIRPFVPGQDEDEWLAVNAAAFATHPEQGHWSRADLDARMAETWFDPAGFLIAEVTTDSLRSAGDESALERGAIAGFHWTKVHDGGTPEAIGEVYVVGVEPRAQGLGLGKTLTLAGLHHLHGDGLAAVLLYVDDDNIAAMRLYERIGFTPYASDVRYKWTK
ncbi:mycothiol synthase [Antricoccus suffuscus]|uniref:Mycothiol acetyltransferase n=1 Tax=Antricoccus suffuscus TaxID=1629062 RepID=A0A2T0YYN1_9ACTN|nr:mycothiol synthase [Antricoccus suffuscus]PRZ29207.1 mycothiol synthase [Antricoccus suffuscus]